MSSGGKEIVVSGIRPTGFLHIGNYFGAMRHYVHMQDEYKCFFFVADWHSLTTHPDTHTLDANVRRVLAENIASGLDPEKAVFYVQSALPEIAELYLYLNSLSYKGELEKTATFKDKVRQQPDNVNAGLLTYPVLQAADILIHRAAKVPVGKDQEQHLEMARNFADRFNKRYEEVFPLPAAFTGERSLLRIMGLDGKGKMSKSENEMATIYLADQDDLIRKKIMRAVTDQGPAAQFAEKPDYIQNLFTLLGLVGTPDTLERFEADYNACTIRYGDLKKQLAEDMAAFVRPIREKAKALQADREYLDRVMRSGSERARASAKETIRLVRGAMRLNYI